jgi:predicted nuclease with TOPRIM domain
MKLYELTNEYLKAYEAIAAAEGEVDDTTSDWLDELQGEVGEKLEGCGRVLANLAGELSAIEGKRKAFEAEAKRLRDKEKSIEAQADRLKKYLIFNLESLGEKKFKTENFAFSVGEPKAVQIDDPTAIPGEFVDYEPKIRKSEIAKELKAGVAVPGATLLTNKSLTIK